MNNKLRNQLLDLVPEGLHSRLAIAGGYAADPEKAEDIDLWVLEVRPAEFDRIEQEIREHLAAQDRMGTPVGIPARTPGNPEMYDEHEGNFRVVAIQAVEDHIHPFGQLIRRVQIIITAQPTLRALVNTFDVSTHAIGYMLLDSEFEGFSCAEDYTSVHCQPRVLKFDRPEQTLPRIKKIAARYGFEPLADDIAQLAFASLAGYAEVPF